MHTHTQSHANLFIFGLCEETPSSPQGRCHLHTLPLNAQAVTGPPAGLSVGQALTLAVKLPQLSQGRTYHNISDDFSIKASIFHLQVVIIECPREK